MSQQIGRHMTEEQIRALPEKELGAIIHSTNPYGCFAQELVWATQECDRRIRRRTARRQP